MCEYCKGTGEVVVARANNDAGVINDEVLAPCLCQNVDPYDVEPYDV